jgi:hypothetical protein
MPSERWTLGKYQILEEVGRGGFGTVYRALDPDLGREVAIKVLDPLLMREPAWVARFRREAQVIAQLDHPHIVTVHEIGQSDWALYIVERLVKGGNLAERIAARGPLPWPEVVRLVDEMAEALDYAHALGVIHRDLKAANVLLDPERGAQLTDFGFARMVAESSFSVSVGGGVVGTPQYIAPEVWEGQPASAQTDVYALGCIVYEMVVGQHLFKGDTTPSVMRAHFQPLVLPGSWPGGVPEGLSDVLQTALAQDPRARYERAGDLAAALAALQDDRLAGPYAALQAAVAAREWSQALTLAGQIRAESPNYRDLAALEMSALQGQEQAARARQAALWREAAEAAWQEGDLLGAERAARQWAALAQEGQAFLDRVRAAAEGPGPRNARNEAEGAEGSAAREADPGSRKARNGAKEVLSSGEAGEREVESPIGTEATAGAVAEGRSRARAAALACALLVEAAGMGYGWFELVSLLLRTL